MFTQIINLDECIDRLKKCRQRCEKSQLEFTRLKASNGLKDLVIKELDQNDKEVSEINVEKLMNKEIALKKNTKYKIFDKNNTELVYKYCLSTDKIILKKKNRQRHLTVGEFGCMLSHLRAIYNVSIGNYDLGLVLEDDVIFADNFKEKCDLILQHAPKDFGILKLDNTNLKGKKHRTSFLFSVLKYGFNRYFYNSRAELLHGVSGATGYIITKQCAQQIVKLLKKETINGLEGAADILYYVVLPKKYNFKNIWIIKKPLLWQNEKESFITKMGR